MMLEKIELSRILFLDVETAPAYRQFDEMPEAMQQFWIKKAERLQKPQDEQSPEQLYFDKAGIYSEFGKIVCISAGFFHYEEDQLRFRVKAFYDHDERILLEAFSGLLQKSFNTQEHYLCGHNAREFDFPYIARRMLVHGLEIPMLLNTQGKKPWEVTMLDTMELWKFGDYKNYTSLALLAALFDIPTPKDDIMGADVARVYWYEDDLERIALYCNKDVVTTARVFLKYCRKGPLPDENVVSVV